MLKPLTDNLLLAVAASYSAKTYIEDAGPSNIFLTSLRAAQVRGEKSATWKVVSEAIDCYKCLSLWLSVLLILLRAVSRRLFVLVTLPLAVSAGFEAVREFWGRHESPDLTARR